MVKLPMVHISPASASSVTPFLPESSHGVVITTYDKDLWVRPYFWP